MEESDKQNEEIREIKNACASIQKIITENPDSITIGSATKGAQIKVYGNFEDLDAFKKKIDNARASRDYANTILN